MEIILIELILWAGLLFFFWALKDGLGSVESDIESTGASPDGGHMLNRQQSVRHSRPQRVDQPIGSFRGQPIYRFAVFDGRTYQFDHVWPAENGLRLGANERSVAPGIVYTACDEREH